MSEKPLATLERRRVALSVEGSDAERFLQDLLTNDVSKAAPEKAVYAALLTPQGKFLADMILWRPAPMRFLMEVSHGLAPDLTRRLTMYKLRSDVRIAPEEALQTQIVWRPDAAIPPLAVDGAVAAGPDPRDPMLGFRIIGGSTDAAPDAEAAPFEAWDRHRIALGAPEPELDLRANDAFPLEYGFERFNGVDFRKGCFVGQEIVARMKHKAELKKGLFRLTLHGGPAPEAGAEIQCDGKPAGTLGSCVDGVGLGLLRFDRAEGALNVGGLAISKAERL